MAHRAPRNIPPHIRDWLAARVERDGLSTVRVALGEIAEPAILRALVGQPIQPGTVAAIVIAYLAEIERDAA